MLLLVDKDEAHCRFLASLAARGGWRTLFAPDLERAIATLGTHDGLLLDAVLIDGRCAPLGLAFVDPSSGSPLGEGAFVGMHGSWNREQPAGYKVVFVPFSGGKPAGGVEDFLTGFLDSEGRAQGRPVGVTVDNEGALLVADDVGDVVWRVSAGQ